MLRHVKRFLFKINYKKYQAEENLQSAISEAFRKGLEEGAERTVSSAIQQAMFFVAKKTYYQSGEMVSAKKEIISILNTIVKSTKPKAEANRLLRYYGEMTEQELDEKLVWRNKP